MSTFGTLYVQQPIVQNSIFMVNQKLASVGDIGLFGSYNSSGIKYSGLFRDAAGTTSSTPGDFVLFDALAVTPNVTTGQISSSSVTRTNLLLNILKAGDGLATAPSLTFGSDLNTGIYHAAADSIGIATNGANKVLINDTTASFASSVTTLTLNATTASNAYNSGALVSLGGIGCDGDINSSGSVKAISIVSSGVGSASAPAYTFTGRAADVGIYSSAANTLNLATAGAVKVTIGATTASVDPSITTVSIGGTTSSTDKDSGALVVTTGGLGVEENINAGGKISAIGVVSAAVGTAAAPAYSFTGRTTDVGVYSSAVKTFNVATNGLVKMTIGDTSASFDAAIATLTLASTQTSTLSSNGALTVTGGVGIGENLNVAGNTVLAGDLIVGGTTTTIHSTVVDISDNLVVVNSGPSTTKDSGLCGMQFPTDIIANTPTVTGTASAGGASTITLVAPAVATADFYVGWYIQITAGTAAGDVKRITAYTVGRLATVDSAWSTPTDNTSVYALYYQVYTGAVYSTGDQEMQLITFPDTDRPNIKSTTTSFLNVRAKQAKLDIGSATNPALMFNGATTTGLYYGSSAINSTVSGSLVSSINASGISMAASTAITNAVGSATSPSYTFTGRTDVGLYTSASNTLDIATNGASKLTIGSTTASLSSVISTLTLNATTTSADYSHGALLVSGGVGIGQNCNIHGNCNITGALSAGSFVPPPKTVKTKSSRAIPT